MLTKPATRLKAYDHYATFFGKGLRTVKRWGAIGAKKTDPFPFDDPPSVPAWWGRCMEYSIPSDVLALCVAKPPAAPTATDAPPTDGGTPPTGTPPANTAGARGLINLQDLAAIGLKENVERLSKIHRANLQLLETAFTGSSDIELQLRQRNAEKSSKMLSDAQRDFDTYEKEHGNLVFLTDVKRDLLRVHTSMAQSLVSLLTGLGIHRERAITTADTWFKNLRESRFATGTAPELRPPAASAA